MSLSLDPWHPPAPATLVDRLAEIGRYRDAVLVLISIDYLLGYFSWSYYAAQNDLGLVPALDAQYLIAGVLPTIILALGIGLVAGHVWFSRWTNRPPTARRYQLGTYLGFSGFGLLVLGLVAAFLFKDMDAWIVPVSAGGAYVMMLGAILQGPRGDKFFRVYGLGVLWVIVAAAPLVLVLFYVEKVLPDVPAALGGPEPRCIHIDLAAQEVTSLTLTPLLQGEPDEIARVLVSRPTIIRTRQLDLLFSEPEFLTVRVDRRVMSIAKDAIRAMTSWR